VRIVVSLMLLSLPLAAVAKEGTRLSLSVYEASGHYGTPLRTTIRSVALGLRHRTGHWTLRASIPWLSIRGAANVLPDGATTAGSAAHRSRRGLGDVNLSVARRLFYDQDLRAGLSARCAVKLPTASRNQGLGTGEADFTVELAPYGYLGGHTWFAALGYRKYGDTPTTDYRDGWLARLGLSHPLSDHQTVGASLRYRQSNRAGRDDQQSLMLFHELHLERGWQTQTYLIRGFSDATAEWAAGLSLMKTL